MGVKNKIVILLSFMLLLVLLIATFLGSRRDDLPSDMPSNFGIVFTYGFQQSLAYSGVDTLKDCVTKDLIMDGIAQVPCILSEKALNEIYRLLHDVHITRYPSEYQTSLSDLLQFRGQRHVTPSMVYSLKIYHGDSLVHSVYWHDSSLSGSFRARALRKCLSEIISIIENTEEYKKLPEKRGGYAYLPFIQNDCNGS